MTINIAVVNHSSNITSSQLSAAISNINSQLANEFYSAWGATATLYVPSGSPASSDYQLILMDNYSQTSILGYHQLTGFGATIGYVFYENAIQNSTSWTVAASHECIEMIMDPNCNLSVATNYSPYQDDSGDQTYLFAFEVCDPVQNSIMAYNINSTMVSNFVYPSWFQSTWGPFETQFDYQWWLFEPFQVGYGGAILVDQPITSYGWQELYGDTVNSHKPTKPPIGHPFPPINSHGFRPVNPKEHSRKQRYLMDRKLWKKSSK